MPEKMSEYAAIYSAIGRLSFVKELHERHLSYLRPFERSLEHVLDAGCGAGLLTKKIAPYAGKVIGIDAEREMIVQARHMINGIRNVELQVGDVCALPFEDAYFDAYVSNNVVHFVSDADALFREMVRVTKPGAIITVSSAHKHCDIEVLVQGMLAEMNGSGEDAKIAEQLAASNRSLMKNVRTLLQPEEAAAYLRHYGCKVVHLGEAYLGQSFFVAGVR